MTAYAPSPNRLQNSSEPGAQQLPPEERDKLQEIHELINLLLREMAATEQARPAAVPIVPAPYAYSFLTFPCG
jgi:hypothetical protein